MYKRAAADRVSLRPLWHVGEGRTLFAGPLHHNGDHRHAVPVYLAGLYGPFELRIAGGDWLTCRTAVIPAGVLYEHYVHGDPIAVFYIEPSVDDANALIPLTRNTSEVRGALVGKTGEFTLLRELWEDSASLRWTEQALDDLLAFSRRRAARRLDDRISNAVGILHRRASSLTPVAELAGAAGLSASRFQHLFTREVSVPYRRYRAWMRMRAAIREIAKGCNFTSAAHAAGFADQAHFNHDFRRTFGAPPSVSLLDVRL